MKFTFLTTILLFLFVGTVTAQKPWEEQQKLIGTTANSIEFSTYLKNEPENKDFSEKYKVLEFWATWCKPCLNAVPHINKLQQEFAYREDLVFISITYETPNETANTLQKVNFETIVATDTKKKIHNELKVEYKGIMALPRTVLIDKNNQIVWCGDPRKLNKKMIEKFLHGEKIEIEH